MHRKTFVLGETQITMSETSESPVAQPRAEKPEFLTEQRFDEFGLPAQLQSALKDAGFVYCTPIQEQTLPISLSGRRISSIAYAGLSSVPATSPVT